MFKKKQCMDEAEGRMFSQVQELCVLCAKGISKISKDTGIHPELVAKIFIETFQHIINKMEEDKK